MWRSRRNRDRRTVVCIACGDSVLREDAREYDKEGNRWDRRNKEFEYLCSECDDELCHQPRDGLESLVLSIESDGLSREEFLDRYTDAVSDSARRPEDG
jgi:DNA-directed RNA polymerase subunit RPC12/RpoP